MSRVQKRNLVLAAGAVLVLLAVYLFLLRANYLAEHQDDGRTVYTLESEQIERLEFTGKEGKVALVRREDGWKYEADESFPLNERFIETMLEKTSVLKAKSRVVKGRNYFEQYGLNTPSNVIRIDAGTEQKVIFLGNINNTTGDSYMYVEGSDQIYSVDATFANLFSTGIYEMASRETLPNMTLDTIIGLEIRTGSTDIMFTKGESIRSTSGESCWNLLWDEGEKMVADDSRVQELLAKLIGLRYEEMVQYSPDGNQLETYGMTTPTAELSIQYMDSNSQREKEFILTVGKQCEGEDKYYAYAQGGAGIYTILSESLEPFFYLAAEDFLSLDVAALQEETLAGLTIWTRNEKIDILIERRAASEQALYRVNGKEITQEEFNSFYYPLYALEADKRVQDLSSQLKSETVLTILYQREPEDGGNVTVEFIPYDQNYYGLRIDGKAVLLMNRQKVNQLLAQIEKLMTL